MTLTTLFSIYMTIGKSLCKSKSVFGEKFILGGRVPVQTSIQSGTRIEAEYDFLKNALLPRES